MQAFTKWFFMALVVLVVGCQSEQESQAETPEQSGSVDTATETRSQPSAGNSNAGRRDFKEGTHYSVLPDKVPTTTGGDRIEVMEVFWYGCGHCFTFKPLVARWGESLPADVALKHTPAIWDQQGIMEGHARIYYTAKALGVLDRIHKATFEAMHEQNRQLRSEREIASLFEENGVSREDFDKTFNSFGVTSAVRQAEARQRSYRIEGTPEVVVEGKYRITARQAGGHQSMLQVAEYLVDKERQARKAESQ